MTLEQFMDARLEACRAELARYESPWSSLGMAETMKKVWQGRIEELNLIDAWIRGGGDACRDPDPGPGHK